jgi:peptide/nickel transport system substrate-binding protein
MKRYPAFISILMFSLLVLGWIPAPNGAATVAAQDKTKLLRVRLYSDIQNMDPAFLVSLNDSTIGYAVFNGLVRYAPNSYDLENQLAEWLETSDNGLEIHFKLREGVMWQKGYGELTTEDVKFSFERMIDPELDAAYADDWATLDHVEIIDKYEGKIILTEPMATLWTTTLPAYSGNIICKKQVEEIGIEQFATDIVGTGPYILQEWRPYEKITLVRNPDYFGEAPYWDEIQLFPIEDDKAAEIALEAGEVDFSAISLASIDRFKADSAYELMVRPSLSYGWIGMNVENPKLQDINVRQAIRYGIDVPSILMATYMGHAEQATTLIPPGLLGYWAEAPAYQRDVEKAKEYMEKAGLESLDLEIAIEDTVEYRTWAEVAQQNLAEIGINLTITPMDSSSFWVIGEGDQGLEVELFANMYASMPDPAWYTMWFVCDQVGVWNWQRWCDPEYDALHQQGLVTLDQEKRNEIYIEMEKIWDAAVHTVWITHPSVAYAYSPDIIPAATPHGEFMVHQFSSAE